MDKYQDIWDIHEATILLDVFLKTKNSTKARIEFIRITSELLRNMSLKKDIAIDEHYRSVSEVSRMMQNLEAIVYGYQIYRPFRPSARLLKQVVTLYRNDNKEFKRLLHKAAMMAIDIKADNRKFRIYLSSNNEINYSKYLDCYKSIEAYCINFDILENALLETTDSKTLERIENIIRYDQVFITRYYTKHKNIVCAFETYYEYLEVEAYNKYEQIFSSLNEEEKNEQISASLNEEEKNEQISASLNEDEHDELMEDSQKVKEVIKTPISQNEVVKDALLLKKYPVVYPKLYEVLKELTEKDSDGTIIAIIKQKMKHIAADRDLEDILENASWVKRDRCRFRFLERTIDETFFAEEFDNIISEQNTDFTNKKITSEFYDMTTQVDIDHKENIDLSNEAAYMHNSETTDYEVIASNKEVQVGKYTLESLTTGMYSDPKIIYREYIQNSVDSLEEAVKRNIIEKQSMRIDIIIDARESVISIKDNGMGISAKNAVQTLINIGKSQKRHTNNRGFRGIGRLGGMSYCDSLVFTTSYDDEPIKTIVSFDCKKLRELLVPGASDHLDLAAVLELVTTIEQLGEKEEKHYFVVEMKGVSAFSDLLNIDVAKKYISQVAPLPYKSKHFFYGSEVRDFLLKHGYVLEEFPVFVGETDKDLDAIYKPNQSRYYSDRNKLKVDEISDVKFFEIKNENELLALGWYGNCNWYGSLSDQLISGIRVRKGNILIGDNKTLNNIFRESRFNGWTQGELFIVTDKLIPNARRDDFEQNEEYYILLNLLRNSVGKEISRTIREASNIRNDNSNKVLNEVKVQVKDAIQILEEGFNSTTDKSNLLASLNKAQVTLAKTKVKDSLLSEKKELENKIIEKMIEANDSSNYKINKINTGIDKKSKKILAIVSDILSQKLSKPLVDDILDEIITTLNRK